MTAKLLAASARYSTAQPTRTADAMIGLPVRAERLGSALRGELLPRLLAPRAFQLRGRRLATQHVYGNDYVQGWPVS